MNEDTQLIKAKMKKWCLWDFFNKLQTIGYPGEAGDEVSGLITIFASN